VNNEALGSYTVTISNIKEPDVLLQTNPYNMYS